MTNFSEKSTHTKQCSKAIFVLDISSGYFRSYEHTVLYVYILQQ